METTSKNIITAVLAVILAVAFIACLVAAIRSNGLVFLAPFIVSVASLIGLLELHGKNFSTYSGLEDED